MNAVARVILVFLALLFIGAALFLLVVNYDLVPQLAVSLPEWAGENVVLAVVAALLLLALIFLSLGFKKSKQPSTAVSKGNEYGEVAISITAIENMVLRVIQQTRKIKDVSRTVTHTQEGLIIKVIIRVMPDVPMPELIKELQSKISDYVEEITGINVQEVKVMVENIIVDQAPSKK